jgi:Rrf2 family protein
MKFTAKGKYGLQIMLDLAEMSAQDHGPVSMKSIAARKNLSENSLCQVMPDLLKAGLVRSVLGTKGGYVIARKPEEILIGDVIRATDGQILAECVNDSERRRDVSIHAVRRVWRQMRDAICAVVDAMTLRQLLDESRVAAD